ncbi:MAG: hypothetical protein JSR77_01150 [Planctomycetes bacterium]|nr:hypothetical protein [Planctomycetota bacterium]
MNYVLKSRWPTAIGTYALPGLIAAAAFSPTFPLRGLVVTLALFWLNPCIIIATAYWYPDRVTALWGALVSEIAFVVLILVAGDVNVQPRLDWDTDQWMGFAMISPGTWGAIIGVGVAAYTQQHRRVLKYALRNDCPTCGYNLDGPLARNMTVHCSECGTLFRPWIDELQIRPDSETSPPMEAAVPELPRQVSSDGAVGELRDRFERHAKRIRRKWNEEDGDASVAARMETAAPEPRN